MKLSLITLKDAEALLAFELCNQSWFEAFIPPREEGFYTLKGVQQHIREFILDYKCNEMMPMLIKDESNQIIGRINVSNIDTAKQTAYLGYRVGQAFTNQGVAKWAVSEATKTLKSRGVSTLIAYAATGNPASQRVLTSSGFEAVKVVHNYAQLNGKPIDCVEFRLTL